MEPRPWPLPATGATRKSERGQVLVLFVLVMLTCTAIATVAISVGQVAVRRHQAQMIVDAAAFAGAAKQAEGLNTIANFNDISLTVLNVIYAATLLPYMDSDTTTYLRIAVGGIPSFFINDWAGDTLKEYQEIFDAIDGAINITNRLYSNLGFPRLEAERVIDANFGNGSDRIFKSADRGSSGYANIADLGKNGGKLVKLTDRDTYTGHFYTYVPYISNAIVQACLTLPFPADIIPCAAVARGYGDLLLFTPIYRTAIPIEYETGRFYDQSEGDDVRFTYSLTVTQAPVMFGKSWFNDIPPITVVASAKPYNGYLGKKFNGGNIIPFSQDKDIRITYQAKLVPVRNLDKILAAGGDVEKALRILH